MNAHPKVKLTGQEKSKHTAAPTTSEYALPGCIQSTKANFLDTAGAIQSNLGVVVQPWAAQQDAETWDNTGDWRSGPDGFFE